MKTQPKLKMTKTEELVQQINSLLPLLGQKPIDLPKIPDSASELDLLRAVKQEYKERLFEVIPQYKILKSEALIPDVMMVALRDREAELMKAG